MRVCEEGVGLVAVSQRRRGLLALIQQQGLVDAHEFEQVESRLSLAAGAGHAEIDSREVRRNRGQIAAVYSAEGTQALPGPLRIAQNCKGGLGNNCEYHPRDPHCREFRIRYSSGSYFYLPFPKKLVLQVFPRASHQFQMNDESTSGNSKKGVVGLTNLGLTCYANAVLQCLRHVERIPWLFTVGRFDTLFKKNATGRLEKQQKVVSSFADVLAQQETGFHPGVLRPAGFFGSLRNCVKDTLYEQFATTAPHDGHEFLMFMLETLHESISIEVDMQIMKRNPTTDEERRVIQALETWKQSFTKEYSPLVDLFYGLLHIQMHCEACGHISHKWETFNTLKMGVPKQNTDPPPDILQLLTQEFEGEVIEDYSCDKCSPTRTKARRSMRIWRLPQTLILCLKRFSYDGRKIHTRVTAPVSQPLSLVTLFSEESPEKGGITDYTLRAIVDHHGGAGGGHYTAQCKDKLSSEWYIYDDEHSHAVQAPFIGESTYILFYERATH